MVSDVSHIVYGRAYRNATVAAAAAAAAPWEKGHSRRVVLLHRRSDCATVYLVAMIPSNRNDFCNGTRFARDELE